MPPTTIGRGFAGKLADPEVRHVRAVKAARARTTTDAHIRAIVERAPVLTSEQIEQLRSLLPPGPESEEAVPT